MWDEKVPVMESKEKAVAFLADTCDNYKPLSNEDLTCQHRGESISVGNKKEYEDFIASLEKEEKECEK